jgi:NAD(P)-dependent dehydrogenase (short-subunit alcohol dehydrogenase family)
MLASAPPRTAHGHFSLLCPSAFRCTSPPCSALRRNHQGKVVVVTGANSGLGRAAAAALAATGATVVMACRSRERAEAAAAAIRHDAAAAGAADCDLEIEVCDVSNLGSIKEFAERFLASGRGLHALVNNAGALLAERGASADGLDRSFATNSLGGLALAARLLPALRKAEGSRVVFVSSGGMYTGGYDFQGGARGQCGGGWGGVNT